MTTTDPTQPGERSSLFGRFIIAIVAVGLLLFLAWFGWTHREKREPGGFLGALPAPAAVG